MVLCFGLTAKAQNYILNTSFEEYNICPSNRGHFNHPKILNGVFVYELEYKVCNTIYVKYGDLTILE